MKKINYFLFIVFFISISVLFYSCEKSNNNNLSDLKISSGELIPVFNPLITEYSVSSLNSLRPIIISATAEKKRAKIIINDSVENGKPFIVNALNRTDKIKIQVTAPNGSVKEYTIAVLPKDFPFLSAEVFKDAFKANLYLSSFSFEKPEVQPNGRYILIYNEKGQPVYYKKMKIAAMDFKKHPDNTYSYNIVDSIFGGIAFGQVVIMDSDFNVTGTYRSNEGITESHEFQLLNNGNKLFLASERKLMDLTQLSGNSKATVFGVVLEEQDTKGKVVFTWKSWNEIKVTDVTPDINIKSLFIPNLHSNSMAVDKDGNILLSSRHLDEITKIDRKTGKIIWRMGGKHCKNNQFKFINDPMNGFSHQHSITILPNGNILMLDNGNLHNNDKPKFVNIPGKKTIIDTNEKPTHISRAVEYKIDEINKTAELVWEYKAKFGTTGMGSVQRLPNGNTLICWGYAIPAVNEINTKGEVVLQLNLPPTYFSDKALKY
jgi:hypothetical protein